MQSRVGRSGRITVPNELRKRYRIQAGDILMWLDYGETIRIIPIPQDPIRALRGRGRGEQLGEQLETAQREERDVHVVTKASGTTEQTD